MRVSRLHIPTLKEDPAEAEVASHRLMVRAGMLRQVARGIYDILPVGLRAVHKVERIVREELDRAGCQEVLMPMVSPAELWRESGRWDVYGKELLRLRDRHDRDFCLGPTHEEVITDLVRRDVRSYRELPLNLYQIAGKFRDEIRPRFGLMRGREFLMKDGYSFHVDFDDCKREYDLMYATYERIFRRCGLEFRAVEAATGNIGGSLSHEFQVLAASGEDTIVSCESCNYAANVEKAEVRASDGATFDAGDVAVIETPGVGTIEDVSEFLGEPAERFVKTLLFVADGKTVAALVRGSHALSEAKLKQALAADELCLAEGDEIESATGAPQGFAGPMGLEVDIVCDHDLAGAEGMITGANQADRHLTGVSQPRDFAGVRFADLRAAGGGDGCGRCDDGVFGEHRGIEVGQVFYLGTKYAEALGATCLDADGNERVMEMGCYGIGITRTVAAAIEQNHDEGGIVWPISIAPYEVVLVPVKWKDEASRDAAEALYKDLGDLGVDVLLDDRDERAGVKFNDADLIGVPLRVTIGPRGLKDGKVEFKARGADEAEELALDGAAAEIARRVVDAHARLAE